MAFSWRGNSLEPKASFGFEIAVFLLPFVMVSSALAEPFQGEVQDKSSQGPLELIKIDFPELVDTSRTGPEASDSSARVLSRFRRGRGQSDGASSVRGRRIPIQVHIPKSGGPFPIIVVSHGAGGNLETL